jgi:hypothetical protein
MSASHLPAPHMAIVPPIPPANGRHGIAPIPDKPIVMLVTPETAADWLENRNVKNRSKSSVTARRYARLIEAKRWKCTHQGIAFDREGWLIDGQHRLMATVATGIPVKLFVIPFVDGMDDETFDVLDSGHKRQAAQLLNGAGANARAAAARYLGVVDDSFGPEHHIVQSIIATSVETADILEVVKQWPELMAWASVMGTANRNAHIPQGPHLAVLAQAERSPHGDRIESWLEGINSGIGLEARDPRLLVRNRFIGGSRLASGHAGQCMAYRLLVKAWNAHAVGSSLGVLRASDSEARPEIVGMKR